MKTTLALVLTAAVATASAEISIPILRSVSTSGNIQRAAKRSQLRAQRRSSSGQSVPLTDWISTTDLQWYGTIQVGTPPQNITVLFDTGSNDLLFPSTACETCTAPSLFDSCTSSTFNSSLGLPSDNITFGTGATNIPSDDASTATGSVVSDTVVLAGTTNLAVENQVFLLLDNSGDAFNMGNIDGIMGLPPVSNSSNLVNTTTTNTTVDLRPYWLRLAEAGSIDDAVFSLYLNSGDNTTGAGGQLTLGGIDYSYVSGSIEYAPLYSYAVERAGEWIVAAPGFAFGELAVYFNTSSLALIDSGTAYIEGPDNATVAALYASLSSEIYPIDDLGSWGAACDVLDSVAPDEIYFTLADATTGALTNLSISGDAFNLGEYPGLDGICQAVVLTPSVAKDYGVDFWTFGSPLIKAYYTIWDAANLQIGFAALATNATRSNSTSTSSDSSSTASSTTVSSAAPAQVGSLLVSAMAVAMTILALY